MAFLKTDLTDNLTDKMKNLSDAELFENLTHPAGAVRAFVLREAALRARENSDLQTQVRRELLADINRKTVIKGSITITLFVLGEMAQNPQKKIEAAVIYASLSENEQKDFVEYFHAPMPKLQTV